MTTSRFEGSEFTKLIEANVEIHRLRTVSAEMLRVLELLEAALAIGNGINRRSMPIGDKTYISQIKAAIAKARK